MYSVCEHWDNCLSDPFIISFYIIINREILEEPTIFLHIRFLRSFRSDQRFRDLVCEEYVGSSFSLKYMCSIILFMTVNLLGVSASVRSISICLSYFLSDIFFTSNDLHNSVLQYCSTWSYNVSLVMCESHHSLWVSETPSVMWVNVEVQHVYCNMITRFKWSTDPVIMFFSQTGKQRDWTGLTDFTQIT